MLLTGCFGRVASVLGRGLDCVRLLAKIAVPPTVLTEKT